MVARLENFSSPRAVEPRAGAADANAAAPDNDIRRLALSGVFWAMLQNWSGKGLSLLLFFILARLLSPAQLGVAAAINVVIVLVGLVAEQGFSDAIVQRRNLRAREINLPFFSSLTISSVLAMAVVLLSSRIEDWMNVPGIAPMLAVAAATLPLSALTLFQEAIYRRRLLFRQVAVRMLVTSAVAGIVAVACAFAGLGSWSLVIQALVMAAGNALWLWYRPLWRPTLEVDAPSYGQLVKFSSHILTARVADALGTRFIELLIAALHGPVALGLYAVGARVFQTLMQLLSSGISTVSLGALSHVAEDRERLARAYLKTMSGSAAIAMPVFVLVASTAHLWTLLFFGAKWQDSSGIMQILMLLGSLQCVQFANGATFSAIGMPRYVAWTAVLKAGTALLAITLTPTSGVKELTVVYALSQLAATPIAYYWLSRRLELRVRTMALAVLPFYVAAACAFAAVHYAGPWLAQHHFDVFASLVSLSVLFTLVYVAVVAATGRRQLQQVWSIFRR